MDEQQLRVQLSVQTVRANGGLSSEDRVLLKQKINKEQRRRRKKDARIYTEMQKSMTAPGLFLCGCDPHDPHVQTFRYEVVNGQLTNIFYDKKGRRVCPIHGRPLYGHATTDKDDPGRELGPVPPVKPSWTEDRRDNRDPTEVGEEYLKLKQQRQQSSNGALPSDLDILVPEEGLGSA